MGQIPTPQLVFEGMKHNEWLDYYEPVDLEASFVGVTSIPEFDSELKEQFSPFYIEGRTGQITTARFFENTGPAIVHSYNTLYPGFSFPATLRRPKRVQISIYNPAVGNSTHFSVRMYPTPTAGGSFDYLLWWTKANKNDVGKRQVWCNTPDAYQLANLGALNAAHTTDVTLYLDPVFEHLGISEENYIGCSIWIANLYNYPAGSGYPAGTYAEAGWCRLNSLSFHWD